MDRNGTQWFCNVQVYSEEQLAICIRVAIEDDCGRHERVTSKEVPQALCSKKSILERKCGDMEESKAEEFLMLFPSLNPFSAQA
jgi:hypothetical protein